MMLKAAILASLIAGGVYHLKQGLETTQVVKRQTAALQENIRERREIMAVLTGDAPLPEIPVQKTVEPPPGGYAFPRFASDGALPGVGTAEMRVGLNECRRLAERWQGRVTVNGRTSDNPKALCGRNNHLVYRIG